MWDLVGNPEDRLSHNEAHLDQVQLGLDTVYLVSNTETPLSITFSNGDLSLNPGLPHYNTPHYNMDFNITRSCHVCYVNNLIITRSYSMDPKDSVIMR